MLKIVGDISLTDGYFNTGFGVGSKLSEGFDPYAHLERKVDDLWVGNFEGVTSEVSNKKGTASLQFRVKPEYLRHLNQFDVYGIANNHAMQHGREAYEQTVDTLEMLGAKCFGQNDRRSIIVEHQGRTISLTGFSQRIDTWREEPSYWNNPEYKEIQKEIEKLPKDAYKIVYVHWGNEFINYPSSQQKKFAHWLIDAGFDMVIGMHPHILQGYEVYKGKHIFYSIGNFVFDMAWEPTHYGAMVSVDFSGQDVRIGTEYVIIGKDFSPQVIDEKELPEKYHFETLNELVSIEQNSEEYHAAINRYYKQYRRANHKDIMRKMVSHPSVAFCVIKDYIKRRFKYVSSYNE